MHHGNYEADSESKTNWRIVSHLVPYLLESRNRVLLALACLLIAKGAILVIPFILKHLVDSLGTEEGQALAATVLIGLVVAYGAAYSITTLHQLVMYIR